MGWGDTASGQVALIRTATGVQRMQDLLVSLGTTGLDNWKLAQATGISDSGRFVVGWGANPSGNLEAWIVELNRFDDVPLSYWAFSDIETIAAAGVTGGCGGDNYCPEDPVTRAQMAVFLERARRGGDFVPPAASGNVFMDVSAESFAAAFIEQLANDGITGGCGNMNYCPADTVTRAQMAVFLLRSKYGSDYIPPPATGIFDDVPLSYWAAAWIEQLSRDGITAGCGNFNFCPDDSVTRGQIAVFLVRAFDEL